MYFALVLTNYMLFSTKPKLLKRVTCELDVQNSQIFVYRDYAGSFHKLYSFNTYLCQWKPALQIVNNICCYTIKNLAG